MRLSAGIILATSVVPSGVLAWGAAGHEIVATIAQIHLHPSAYPTICSILNFTSPEPNKPLCFLAPVATWADRVRYHMRWSAPLHYVGAIGDHPSQTCLFPGEEGWEGKNSQNVLSATRNVTNILEAFMKKQKEGIKAMREETELANEALKFLIHFMGDLHQPLHLTGRDRGGNSDKVLFGRRHTNLHSVWDNFLIAKAIRTTPKKYDHPSKDKRVEHSLRGAVYDPYIRQIMAEGILKDWKPELPEWVSCPAFDVMKGASAAMTARQQVLALWDRLIGTKDTAADTDDQHVCPFTWAKGIHGLNCEIVWPKELDQASYRGQWTSSQDDDVPCSVEEELALMDDSDEASYPNGEELDLDTPEYAGVIAKRRLVEKLLAQAGVRLANTLNFLFADESMV